MSADISVTAFATRSNGVFSERPLTVRITPKIKRGKTIASGPGMWFKEPDRSAWFNLYLDEMDKPDDGLFELWTKQWNKDEIDSEYPMAYWKFPNTYWRTRKNWIYGRCHSWEFQYIKEISK